MRYYNKLLDVLFWALIGIFIVPIIIILVYIVLSDRIKWNHGICRKCKSDKLTLTHKDEKHFLSNTYICKTCNHTTRIFEDFKVLSNEDTISTIRDNKLKSIL